MADLLDRMKLDEKLAQMTIFSFPGDHPREDKEGPVDLGHTVRAALAALVGVAAVGERPYNPTPLRKYTKARLNPDGHFC